MAVDSQFQDYIAEMLEPMGGVSVRRMFGGVGLFRQGLMFGLIFGDTLYLKTDAGNRPDFEAAGCSRFTYQSRNRERDLGYYTLPAEALDDAQEMLDWADSAFQAACRADAARPPSKQKRI